MTSTKYTKELLQQQVATSLSYAGVLRGLGIKQAGGSQAHIIKKIKYFGIDTSHFTGSVHNKGKVALNKLPADEVLVISLEGSLRKRRPILKRAMMEKGVDYKCALCSIINWQEKELCLEIDHISGDWLDNRLENLRFLCPNCHSQQENTNKPHKYGALAQRQEAYHLG